MQSQKMKKVLKTLQSLAKDSDPVSKARLTAAILHKNKIIATGKNQYKTHPMMSRFKKNDEAIFLHAEVDVINKARKLLTPKELSESTLVVVRVLKDGSFAMAKPCEGCANCIDHHKVARTYFTNYEGILECI